MDFQKGNEKSDWGFQNPAKGKHRVVIVEGTGFHTNANTGNSSFRIAMECMGGESEGIQFSEFISTKLKDFERRIAAVMVNTDLVEDMEAKFPGKVPLTSQPLLETLGIKLVGKTLVVDVDLQKDKEGVERPRVRSIERDSKAVKTSVAAAPAGGDDGGWE
jgi:hypothetical protein